MTVGGQLSNGKLTMPSGGSLTLGTSGSPTNLTVSESDLATGQSYQGQMTVSGGTFNANLSSLAVGVKTAGARQPDRLVARRKCGPLVVIGSPGSLGTVTIGQATSGGGQTGTVDFSGQASLTASLSHLTVGSGTGSLLLPNTNTIDTQSLVVGDTNGNGTLRLGTQNSLLADTMQVGNSYANASVTMPAGGTLSLGSPTRPTDLSVGTC